jgi:hypothetical protein
MTWVPPAKLQPPTRRFFIRIERAIRARGVRFFLSFGLVAT